MSEASPDDMWTPFKLLNSVVESYIIAGDQQNTNLSNLEIALRKHKQNFTTLLKNPPKNAKSREEIRHGSEGVMLPGIGHTILAKDLVDETLILSDMYDLNEYMALELLCTAQQQMSNHPGLPRGLVAVLLYYDGRKSLVSTLKNLFQARSGVSWCTESSADVTQLITNYTDNLVADGCLNKIIDLLASLDISEETEKLTNNRALGPPKHHQQVIDLFEEIRMQLATALFNWSAQCGLPCATTIKLIKFLAKYKPTESYGGLDNVTITLQMALLYALDVSVVQRREDGEEVVRNLPLIKDDEFINAVMEQLATPWECEGLRSLAFFSFGLAIATIRLIPQHLYPNISRIIDQDEQLIDGSLQGRVFDFIHYTFLENELIFKTEFFYRRMHILFTDFIELMHSKVTELRARAEETARTVQGYLKQGLDSPPNLCRSFENLLLGVGKLYGNDSMHLNLSLEYWGPMEIAENYQRSSSRSVCLFKFIRLAGELLPPPLFIPYLKMLAGLSTGQQSARNAFNLLKQGSGVSSSINISWDHFFTSIARYYTNLRQEQLPGSETVYRNRALCRINPQEIVGLQAVLLVTRTVATYDDVARVALCEHPSWSPLQVLLGLVSCSVSVSLKAELIRTLAALGKSKETSLQLWNNLESSQIITTIPTTNTFANRGIESELEEIESRDEVYPLTQAVLDLLYSLSSTTIPRNLGAGPRKPGLDPYLTFIINAVFLRFYNRNYKDLAEKWIVAEKSLKVLNLFIKSYEVSPQDFPVTSGQFVKEENSPPGFHVMLQLHTKSEFLRLLLHIIDEAVTLFDSYTQFPGKKYLERTVYYCLNLIERTLAQQDLFFDAHFNANCSILLSGLNKLLLGVNPRSGKPDHMLNITKFVTYNSWLPCHALSAIKILKMVTRQPNVNPQILGLFTQTEKLKLEIRQGFVECLENELLTEIDIMMDTDNYSIEVEDNLGDDIELNIKESVILLIQECLPQATPNVAHYLLGFDTTKDIRTARLGFMDFPRSCLKSLLTILDGALEDSKQGKVASARQERLVDSAYALLYTLCYNLQISELILRFLRSYQNFLCRHIAALPFNHYQSPRVLNQMTGLLKCIAIELKIASTNGQLKQFEDLCKILLDVGQSQATVGKGQYNTETVSADLSHYYSMSMNNTTIGGLASVTHDATATGEYKKQKKSNDSKLLICHLLDCLDFETQQLEKPRWDYFDNIMMQKLLHSCEVMAPSVGRKLIDIKKLQDILKDELNSIQTTIATGQRQHILQEIETVLVFALQLNSQKTVASSTIRFMEAWGQVVEILFTVAPVSSDLKQSLILEIIQALLNRIPPMEIMTELADLASSTVFLLLVNLRHCTTFKSSEGAANQTLANFSNSSLTLLLHNQTQQQTATSLKSNTLILKYILKTIVEWIIMSGVASQKLKINLYAALLNFMHILKGERQTEDVDGVKDERYVTLLDRTVRNRTASGAGLDDDTNLIEMGVEVFQSFGDKLFDILCHDATVGHDVAKMLALSCIDMLLDLDAMTNFIYFISKRGYLANLIDSLLKNDSKLCRVLDTNPDNLKPLYVYESKMAMLSRVSSSYIGAELLLEQKALAVLAGMKVFDLHPDFQVTNYNNKYPLTSATSSFIPPIETRYQQILFPALNLCDVILSTLGSDNRSTVTQIIHFLLSHGDMIEIVLRAGTPFSNLGLLQELSGITGIIARAANQGVSNLIDAQENQDLGTHLYRLQKLMLTLFPRFLLTDKMLKEKMQNIDETVRASHMKCILEVATNLALYARNSVTNHSVDHRVTSVLFAPTINEGSYRNETYNSGSLETSPSLGIVVAQLKSGVEHYNREKQMYEDLLRQRNSLTSLSLDSNVQTQHSNLTQRLTEKQTELKLSVLVTEHCLFLLWAHLDFFMLRSIPVNPLQFNAGLATHYNSEPTPLEMGWKTTSEDISGLKKALVAVFNETFCKQLMNTTANQSNSDKGFVESMLRRIKRLIQFVPVK